MNRSNTHLASLVKASSAGLVLTGASISLASIQTVQSVETPSCDVLMNLTVVDELGLTPPFPANESIIAGFQQTTLSACPGTDLSSIPNVQVRIINLTGQSFTDVHYVADPASAGVGGTSITNEDGLVNGGQAFRIDTVGVNKPLVLESGIADGIFSPGESWVFIIDDYVNSFGSPPSLFSSIGVGAASGPGGSSGSIIALPVPEPTTGAAMAMAVLPLLRRTRRRTPR